MPLVVYVCMCVYLSAANHTYYWTHQPNIFEHTYNCMLKDLSWLWWFKVLSTALFYIAIDCWVLAPLNQLPGATSNHGSVWQLFYIVLVASFVGIFTLKLAFYTAVFRNLDVSDSFHCSHAYIINRQHLARIRSDMSTVFHIISFFVTLHLLFTINGSHISANVSFIS